MSVQVSAEKKATITFGNDEWPVGDHVCEEEELWSVVFASGALLRLDLSSALELQHMLNERFA